MKQDEKELCGWFIFCPKQQLLLVKDGDRFHIPYSVEPPVQLPADTPIHTVGEILGHPAKACALPLEALTGQNTSFIPDKSGCSCPMSVFERLYLRIGILPVAVHRTKHAGLSE